MSDAVLLCCLLCVIVLPTRSVVSVDVFFFSNLPANVFGDSCLATVFMVKVSCGYTVDRSRAILNQKESFSCMNL